MKKNTPPIECDRFYHIYNRGINRERIFKHARNYRYFLNRYEAYIPKVAKTYAYSLLGNHFHLLIKTKSRDELLAGAEDTTALAPEQQISRQFGNLFNSYAQAINKEWHRTGGLFETPFRRVPVFDVDYLTRLIFYIHFNAKKHMATTSLYDYRWSSYKSLTQKGKTILERNEILGWFGGREEMIRAHANWEMEGFSTLLFVLPGA